MDAWVLATYAGCDIRCTYCIVSAQGTSVPRFPRDEVADRLRFELDRFSSPPRLGVGAYTDVYPQAEARLGVTRPALEVLTEHHVAYTLVTKGNTVLRDVDLFTDRSQVAIQISLCSTDEDALARLDPGAPSGAERLSMSHTLLDAGVRVRVQASPWIPGVTDLVALLDRLDPRIPVTTTPLRVPDHIRRTPFGRPYDQREINAAFRREYERIGEVPRLVWSRPPAETVRRRTSATTTACRASWTGRRRGRRPTWVPRSTRCAVRRGPSGSSSSGGLGRCPPPADRRDQPGRPSATSGSSTRSGCSCSSRCTQYWLSNSASRVPSARCTTWVPRMPMSCSALAASVRRAIV
jgi:hypothetical protein